MINWVYFPKNKKCDDMSVKVIRAFQTKAKEIDSSVHTYKSNAVLSIVRSELESIGFEVERGNRDEDKVIMPVLYGINGNVEKSFEVDGFNSEYGYVIEVEAGRGYANNQFLKDFFEVTSMDDADRLCIAVRNIYKTKNTSSKDFEKVCKFFESLYVSGRLKVPLSSVLIIGY